MVFSTVVAGAITNCRRSATKVASSTPSTSTTAPAIHTLEASPPWCRAELISTRYTCGTARATMLASSAETMPSIRRGRMGFRCG